MNRPIGQLAMSVSALTLSILIPAPALAQSNDVGALQQEIEDLRGRERTALERIERLEYRLEALEAMLQLDATVTVPDERQALMRGRGTGGVYPQNREASVQQANYQEGEQPSISSTAGSGDRKAPAPTEAVETIAEREQGYFGRKFSVEIGANYAHFGDARVNLSGFLALDAIFLGTISIEETKADIVTFDVAGRMGITDRLQVDLDVPYLYRHAYYQSGGAGGNAEGLVDTSRSDTGIGDVSAGVSYRLLTETFDRPDVVANVRVKAPTGRHPFGVELVEVAGSEGNLSVPGNLSFGTGVWSTSAGVSVLKSIDPMVVFGSATYFRNWKESFADIDEAAGDQPGTANIGDAFQYGAGVAFALNERSSLSTSFTQRFVQKTKLRRMGQEWQKVVGSQANVALLNFGATFSLDERTSLQATASIGMTDDAPDMVVGVRVPYVF